MKRQGLLALPFLFALGVQSCQQNPPQTPPVVTAQPPLPPPSASSSASAGEPAWTPTPDAEFRQKPPVASAEVAWQAPIPESATLSNGMKLLVVSRPALPVTVLYFATRRGADLQALPGLGSFAGEMLAQGTKTRTALQLSDDFENLGAEHQAWVDWDSGNLWVKVLSQHADKALEIVADMLINPAFDKDEVERVRSQRLAAIAQQADVPDVLLRNTVARTVYRGHPYGESLLGTAASVAKFTPDNLRAFYAARFTPDQMVAIVVGDITKQSAQDRLEKAFGGWKTKSRATTPVPPPPPGTREIVLVDRPGAPQSNIAVVGPGVARTTQDFDTLLVTNTILGGMFSSRLNLNLREKHSWTYGARSSFDMRRGPGPFSAGAAVDTPNTAPAIVEILSEIDRLSKELVSDEDLTLAKGTLTKSMPGRFETDASTAAALAWLGIYDLPLDEYRTRPQRVQRVTAADVQNAAKKYLDSKKMRIVVVGNRSVIEPELKKLKLGNIVVLQTATKPKTK